MAEFDELSELVENSPDNFELRWRLAKGLYRTGDYRTALRHLQILRGQWKPKINVARYLAAVYYRLGRYDQSIAELEDAITEWEGEMPLREQLARVYEVAGRKERAILTWKNILKIKKDHDFAQENIDRLENRTPPPMPHYVPSLNDRDFGLDAGTGFMCPNCGTLNSSDFDRCWKCNARIAHTPTPKSSVPEPLTASPLDIWDTVAGVAALFFLGLAALLALRQYQINCKSMTDLAAIESVQHMLNEKMWLTRLILGLALAVGWPLSIWIGITLTRASRVEVKTIATTGAFFAGAVILTFWLPFHWSVVLIPVLVALSVIPIWFLFPMGRIQRGITMAIEAMLVLCLIYIVVGLREGNAVISAMPIMYRYSTAQARLPELRQHLVPTATVPVKAAIKWESTGSSWLDSRAGRSLFTISSPASSAEIVVEMTDGDRSVYYNRATEFPFRFLFEAQPDKTYHLLVNGTEGTTLEITINGLLKPRVEL